MLNYGWLQSFLHFEWLFWLVSVVVLGTLTLKLIINSGEALTNWTQSSREQNARLRGAAVNIVLGLFFLHALGIFDSVSAIYHNWMTVGIYVLSYLAIGFLYTHLNGLYEALKERRRRRRELMTARESFLKDKRASHTGPDPFSADLYQTEWEKWKQQSDLLVPPDVSKYKSRLMAWCFLWFPHLIYRVTTRWIQGIVDLVSWMWDRLRGFHQAVINYLWKDIDRGI